MWKAWSVGVQVRPLLASNGTAELLDDVVGEISKSIEGGDHLVVVEGFCRSLAEEKDSLEHGNCVLANSCLDEGRVTLRVFCFFSVGIVQSIHQS